MIKVESFLYFKGFLEEDGKIVGLRWGGKGDKEVCLKIIGGVCFN